MFTEEELQIINKVISETSVKNGSQVNMKLLMIQAKIAKRAKRDKLQDNQNEKPEQRTEV